MFKQDWSFFDSLLAAVEKKMSSYARVAAKNGILLPKLFWPTLRKKCSSDWEFFLKFDAEGWEFAKILWSLEPFFFLIVGQNNF